MKDDTSHQNQRPESQDDYAAWIQSRKDIQAPTDLVDRIMDTLPGDEAIPEIEEIEEGRFKLVKAAVIVGAALVGISRMAAVFVWILIP